MRLGIMRWTLPLLLLVPFFILGQEPDDDLRNPADDAIHAWKHIITMPVDQRLYIRYLTLYNIHPKYRLGEIKVLNGHVNGLSSETDLEPVHVVPGTNNALVWINTQDYGEVFSNVYDRLAEEDPYGHVNLVDTAVYPWEGGVWPGDGRYYRAGAFTYTKPAKRALAPIYSETPVHVAALAELIKWTQGAAPILRADWFLNQTAAAVDRKANYYTFLGVKTEKDFQRLIGFDQKTADRFISLRDAVGESGVNVTGVRAILREDKGYWRTFDFKVAKDEKDPLRIIGKDIQKKADASEQYGFLPNGLWTTAAVKVSDGTVQDTVPDFIAAHNRSRSNDKRIHVNISCMECHTNGGLQDLDGVWFRGLLGTGTQFNFVNPDDQRKFRQQYVARRLAPWIAKDRAAFDEAVREATGFASATEYYAAYSATWRWYEDARIGLASASRDLGVTPKMLKDALAVRAIINQADVVLKTMYDGKTVPIRQWEQSFQLAYIELRAYKGK